MLDHHLQRGIVYQLAFQPHSRFSDLKPDDVDNKLFTYHLKKVLKAGYVIKSEDGSYALSADGRRLSTGVKDKEQTLIIERAHSVLFLVIRRASDGAWLLYRRQTHPMLGFGGFMHTNPTVDQTVEAAARDQCLRKTGLDGAFTALGGGYFRVYEQSRVESFTHFTLLYCDDISGSLQPTDHQATYVWAMDPLAGEDIFPATPVLYEAYLRKQPFLLNKRLKFKPAYCRPELNDRMPCTHRRVPLDG